MKNVEIQFLTLLSLIVLCASGQALIHLGVQGRLK